MSLMCLLSCSRLFSNTGVADTSLVMSDMLIRPVTVAFLGVVLFLLKLISLWMDDSFVEQQIKLVSITTLPRNGKVPLSIIRIEAFDKRLSSK